jgi:hypothetical protein
MDQPFLATANHVHVSETMRQDACEKLELWCEWVAARFGAAF